MRPLSTTLEPVGERAVSEIMGVTMLLAMVISTMAGVMIVMQPFMQDLNDNRDWVSGSVAATQLNDRILVVAESPEGSGLVINSQHVSDTIKPLRNAEIWQISTDLFGEDRVVISLENGRFNISSLNNTAAAVEIRTPSGSESWTLNDGDGENTTNLSMQDWVILDVTDSEGDLIHRWVQIPLDGIQLRTPLTEGMFEVNLVNGARIEQLPNQPITVQSFPRLVCEQTLDGGLRVSLVMIDVEIAGGERSIGQALDVESRGAFVLFEHEARNLKIVPEFTGVDNPESRYLRHWTDNYDLHRATGDSSDYIGFGPDGRLSGTEGMTLYPTSQNFQLDVIVQQVVVQ